MKSKIIAFSMALFLIAVQTQCVFAAERSTDSGVDSGVDSGSFSGSGLAVYRGVVGYGTAAADRNGNLENLKNFTYYFDVNGTEKIYKISPDNNFALNNMLAEGYVFDITVEDDTVVDVRVPAPSAVGTITHIGSDCIRVDERQVAITPATKVYQITAEAGGATVTPSTLTSGKTVKVYGNPAELIYLTFVAEPYTPPIRNTPGKKTLKNVLATALQPAGTALYIYGGTWDWQDEGSQAATGTSAPQATTIGVPQTWIDFFQAQDSYFTYKNSSDYTQSYYPHKSYNEYYYAGPDCSGYMSWVIYNVAHAVSGLPGYVHSATKEAKLYADKGFGSFTKVESADALQISDFKPGDIFSMSGHIWMCVGTCEDGSMVILHSTPSASYQGEGGGGVQLSAIAPQNGAPGEECQAYALAQKYMTEHFPEWSKRYPVVYKNWSSYITYSTNPKTFVGKFSWAIDGSYLTDPDSYVTMTAAEILDNLFTTLPPKTHGKSGSRTAEERQTEETLFWNQFLMATAKTTTDGTITLDATRYQQIPYWVVDMLAGKAITLEMTYLSADGSTDKALIACGAIKPTGANRIFYCAADFAKQYGKTA